MLGRVLGCKGMHVRGARRSGRAAGVHGRCAGGVKRAVRRAGARAGARQAHCRRTGHTAGAWARGRRMASDCHYSPESTR
ncbi:hypothetical protein CDL15_Pgr005102 [Punica granatum]|uniref:Uncharacterized protein n=1 Tax=Punica granatum TaxID=22663 RepID=A0A218WPJ3_PUNGR|nr:hypothetical protein CDL15_Pgr005102 [Punica granatum]